MGEDQNQSVANTDGTPTNGVVAGTKEPATQPTSGVDGKTAQKDQAVAPDTKKGADQGTSPQSADQAHTVKPDVSKEQGNADTKADAGQSTQIKPTTPSAVPTDNSTQASDADNQGKNDPKKTSAQNTTEPQKKLSDVVPSTIVWISGMVGNKQIDCAGPFEAPFKIDKPTWPYVNVAPNPNYTNQVFDYDADGGAGRWVPTDAKSQGQMLTDLIKQVTVLQDDSQKHDQTADQSQKMGMQLTKVMLQLSSKVDALNTKIDGIVNDKKDGDK